MMMMIERMIKDDGVKMPSVLQRGHDVILTSQKINRPIQTLCPFYVRCLRLDLECVASSDKKRMRALSDVESLPAARRKIGSGNRSTSDYYSAESSGSSEDEVEGAARSKLCGSAHCHKDRGEISNDQGRVSRRANWEPLPYTEPLHDLGADEVMPLHDQENK